MNQRRHGLNPDTAHGLLCEGSPWRFCPSSSRIWSRTSFRRCLSSPQPWKVAVCTVGRAETEGRFASLLVCYVPLWANVGDLRAAPVRLGLPKLRVPGGDRPWHVQHLPESLRVTPWDTGARALTQACSSWACCAMSTEVLCL